ncbi:RNB domain-containing ribonuclease [Gordonia sp. (in: high G+C Gram-positive bacteria)]|uniref:RNB domain-containing ribonuclease n=1 Tax=Gordonia sp. (in: high G+C Gram-positive bacteria) TaxID=84139 RepID=UPI0016A98C9B|nr:RNB domain-containing ribonuclease [Gordonia sp. (in: high G+C Gram-positive bacteria)]NLG46925.1 RNB domain-containing ribonuclease [Gordonia sp. (in: high G+C Gram-positive bacteria)]
MQPRTSAPAIDFAQLRHDLGIVVDFSREVERQAESVVDRFAADRADRTDLELVTIDPPGSKDLDQALRVVAEPDGGFLVHYAIADVAALVEPDSPIDVESRRRGQTLYFPDGSVPLHPRALSEGLGSLLPDQTRPAVLWTVHVAADGEARSVDVTRASVRSRARLDYAGVMGDLAADRLHPAIAGLPDFGRTRLTWALRRGAVQLDLPDQEIVPHTPGRAWTLRLAPRTPADQWNAQVSLLTGMCAGTAQAEAGVGLLRTLPPAAQESVDDLRRIAQHLQIPWPDDASPGQFLATLRPEAPTTLALMSAGARLMRGSGYLVLDAETADLPVDQRAHAGVGGLYAHVTAPLRRLADRYATEVTLAVTAGREVPDWVAEVLPTLPKIMRGTDSEASTAERKSLALTEAVVLSDQIGARFDAVVLRDRDGRRPAEVLIEEPAIVAACRDAPGAGTRCTVEVMTADPTIPDVMFRAVSGRGGTS